MSGIETADTFGEKATLPADNIILVALQGLHKLTGMACREFEDELGPLDIIASRAARRGPPFEFQSLRRRRRNSASLHLAKKWPSR